MNTLKPIIERILPLLERRLPACLRKPTPPRCRIEIQLEFPWPRKK